MEENKKIKAIVINHGHLDVEWYKTLDAYRFWVLKIIDCLYDEAIYKKNYVSYIFDGSVFLLDDLVAYYPNYKQKIKKLIKLGKLTIGPFYTQFDEWIPSGESMVKNCVWGDRKSREYNAKPMKVGYLPDNFGHPSQLPQILNQFGIDNLIFMRGMMDIDYGREFYFIGQDGSKLLAVNYNYATNFLFANNSPENNNPRSIPYFDVMNPSEEKLKQFSLHKNDKLAEDIIQSVKENKSNFSQNTICIPMGCDHCPPQIGLGDTLEKANKLQNEVEFIFGTPVDYINNLRKGKIDCTFKGELIGCKSECILLGVLFDRIYQKIDHFASEKLLFNYALPLEALQSSFGIGYDVNNSRILDNVVRNILVNSAHDSIHGSCVDGAHMEIDARNVFNKQVCAEVILDSLNTMSSKLGKWWADDERCLIVYNPTNRSSKQVVSAWFPIGEDGIIIKDKNGNVFETTIFDRDNVEKNIQDNPYYSELPSKEFRNVKFLAELKPYSVQTFAWKKDIKIDKFIVNTDDKFIENEFIKVSAIGALIDIVDKETGFRYNNLNNLADRRDAGDAWDYSEPYIDYDVINSKDGVIDDICVKKSNLFEEMNIRGHYSVPYELVGDYVSERMAEICYEYKIVLTKGIKRVDVKLIFNNAAKDHITSLEIPVDFISKNVTSKGAFCINDREIVPYGPHKGWVAMPTEFYPFNEWLSVDDGKNGLAIAVKGLCGYKAIHQDGKTIVELPINRSFGIMNKTFMKRRRCAPGSGWKVDDAQCIRKTEIEFSYIPFVVDDTGNHLVSYIDSFINPSVALCTYKSVQYDNYKADLFQPFEIDNDRLNISIFEKTYDKKYNLLRLYETNGKTERLKIKFNKVSQVFLSNLNEEKRIELDVKDNGIEIAVNPKEIVTLLWR